MQGITCEMHERRYLEKFWGISGTDVPVSLRSCSFTRGFLMAQLPTLFLAFTKAQI